MSRITITTHASPQLLEQCMKQIRRLVNVIKLRDMTGEEAVKREIALICVKAEPENRTAIMEIIDNYRGKILEQGVHQYIFEATGDENTIDLLLAELEPFGVKKLARSGVLALYKEKESV
jgi:acetolactate synthase-1/3 small subunit